MRHLFLAITILLAGDLISQTNLPTDNLTTNPNTHTRKIENAFGIRSFVNTESAYALLGNSHTYYGHINNSEVSKKASLFYGEMNGTHLIEYGLYLDDINPKGTGNNITMKHFIEGNVGLGVTNPLAALDVLGNVKLGSYTGSNYNATPSYLLGVDDYGNVVKTPYFKSRKTNTKKIQKEISEELSTLKEYIAQLEDRLYHLEQIQVSAAHQIKVAISNSIELEIPYLSQNLPNPSTQNTTIKYYIPESASEASVKFFSLSGQILKEVEIDIFGQGEIALDVEKMIGGNYMYALVVDGELIDTKSMVIVR